jgi:hypothetical protein
VKNNRLTITVDDFISSLQLGVVVGLVTTIVTHFPVLAIRGFVSLIDGSFSIIGSWIGSILVVFAVVCILFTLGALLHKLNDKKHEKNGQISFYIVLCAFIVFTVLCMFVVFKFLGG